MGNAGLAAYINSLWAPVRFSASVVNLLHEYPASHQDSWFPWQAKSGEATHCLFRVGVIVTPPYTTLDLLVLPWALECSLDVNGPKLDSMISDGPPIDILGVDIRHF